VRTHRLNELPAWQAAALLQRRELRAQDLLRACLERIELREPDVQAFVALAADAALAQARALDAGALRGPLHGLPLGVKDLFDTADLPTAYGTPIYAGHRPAADAAAVALCREAGAVLLGKTVSTELATMQPGSTRNPHDLAHTPGGSSSGSVAAVADFMLPLALGTQTAGSIIRPAAYCGVVGYKPSLGRVPRAGIKLQSESCDTAGGFGRSVRDVALLGAALLGDPRLNDPRAPEAPRIGLAPTPQWPQADADTQHVWAEAVRTLAPLAADCRDADLPEGFADLVGLQKAVMCFEAARSLTHERVHHRERLSPALRAMLDEGLAIDGPAHARHLQAVTQGRARIDALFERHDVLLTPSTIGTAPLLDTTGDPLFCRAWSLLGLPCVHLPFGRGAKGLPVGLQLVGRHGEDHRLLAAAQWVHERLSG
jgi:Asp-tRNA(Asn)/Glu-tRNA(Gln) amidotransferase A subunit family amidase